MTVNTGIVQGSLTNEEFDLLDEVNNYAYFVTSRSKTLLIVLHDQEAGNFYEKRFVSFYYNLKQLQEKGEAIASWSLNSISLQHFPGDNELTDISALVKQLQKRAIDAEYDYRILISAGRPLGREEEMNKMLALIENSLQGLKTQIGKAKAMNDRA